MKTPKFVFLSKTILVNIAGIAATLFFPPAAAVVAQHPQETVALFGAVNLVLRLVTKDAVALFPEDEAPERDRDTPRFHDDDIPY